MLADLGRQVPLWDAAVNGVRDRERRAPSVNDTIAERCHAESLLCSGSDARARVSMRRERDPDLSLTTLAGDLRGHTGCTADRLFADAVRVIDEFEVDPAALGVVIAASVCSLGGPTLARRSEPCLP